MYYAEKLAGRRLQRCYEIAPARVRRYLEAEIAHVQSRLRSNDRVLELGCGYGRVTHRLSRIAGQVVGIDTARESLHLAQQLASPEDHCAYLAMDAIDLGFPDRSFDAVVCIQNGICAFGVNPLHLLHESLRVTRVGGIVLFSSYADEFWDERLAWFELQAAEGLLGRIDRVASGNGVIVCEDGFRAGRMTPTDFHALGERLGVELSTCVVDASSVFCEIDRPAQLALLIERR